MDLAELIHLMPQSLRKPGFHVIAIDIHEDIDSSETIERKQVSFINFLRIVEREDVPRYLRVDGLDDFMAKAGEEGLEKLKVKLNEKMGTLVSNMSSIVFVVRPISKT